MVQAGPWEDSTGVTVEAFDFYKSYTKSHFQVAVTYLVFFFPRGGRWYGDKPAGGHCDPELPREGSGRQWYDTLGVLWLTEQKVDCHGKHTGSEGRAAQRHWGLLVLSGWSPGWDCALAGRW